MELVAVRLDLLEEARDAGEAAVARVDERARRVGKLLPGRIGVQLVPARGLQQLALIPLAGGMRPGLDGALRQALAPIGHDERFVVSQDIAEALALGAGAERVVEREEERLRPLECLPAAAAAEVLGEDARGPIEHLDVDLPSALPQRRLDRLGDPCAVRGLEHDAVQDHRDRPVLGEVRGRRRCQVVERAVHAHAREAAPVQARPQLRRRQRPGHREPERDVSARAGMLAEERADDRLGRVRGRGRTARGAVDAPDLRVEQPQIIVDLGGGGDRRARRPHRILLLESDRGPDLLDPVDVGAVHPIEEHTGVRGQRLDVTPLPLGEERVEGERGLPGAGHAGDDREPVVRDLERDVLEVVLPGSADPEPRGLGHSSGPPEVGSLAEADETRQRAGPELTAARAPGTLRFVVDNDY